MKLYKAGAVAVVVVGGLMLAACSSSAKPNSNSTSTPAGGTPTSSAAAAIQCVSGNLTSDGSTAQQNAINNWIKNYQTACSGAKIVYSGGGSGQGITDFTQGKVDFAGSDAAFTAAEMTAATARCGAGSQAIDLPMVTGPIAVAYKVSGVSNLVLTPDVVAKIFTGKITTWNDPAITALNSGATLPSAKITVFFRSDSSGTTQNFERYLSGNDPTDYPTTPSKTWTGVGQGKTGSQGIQQAVESTDDSIGYLEWSYAGSAGVPMAQIDQGSGAVSLTATSAGLAVQAATVAGTSPDLSLKLDYATKASGAYPIILVTYELVCTKYSNPAVGALVKSFLTYTSSAAGQATLPSVGSAPLPSSVLTQVQSVVAQIS